MTPLDPTGNPVQIGRIRLRTPGLRGQAEIHPPASAGLRAAEAATPQLEAALASQAIVLQETIEIRDTAEVRVAPEVVSRTAQLEPALEVEVPDAGEAFGQVLLYKDEAGVITWNFPVAEAAADGTTRGSATRRYVIRRHVPPAPAHPAHRGLFGALGTKVLKILAFKLLDPIAGAIGPCFVRRWEEKQRPYLVRSFTPDNYAQPFVPPFGAADWTRLQSARSLLMIHGTISRTHTAFGALDRATVQELDRRYEGRMFAFDHFTMSDDPLENACHLVRSMPDDAQLDLDIVCHSRGGLVARVLAEQLPALSLGARRLRVHRIVFVAVPNAGTTLADMKYLPDFIDTYTNLLNFLPDSGVIEAFECILTVVKQIAVGMVKELDGLQSMLPGGPFLQNLNRGPAGDAAYFAMSSNYEPIDPGWKAWVIDRVLDRIFQQQGNDLVVPAAGVADANGSGRFPIRQSHAFLPADGIAHTRFFGQPPVRQQLLSWLTRP